MQSSRDFRQSRQLESEEDGKNWLIHRLYLRQEYEECMELIEEVMTSSQGLSEYPIYVKALILRHYGKVEQSLQLFQAISCLNPGNKENIKQIGRSLLLLGKHANAIKIFKEVLTQEKAEDWRVHLNIGTCFTFLKQFDNAIQSFQRANAISRHDTTFLQLANVYMIQNDYKNAIITYQEALEFSPDNPKLLSGLGLAYLRNGESFAAFDHLGNSLTHDPLDPKTILAAGSIIQDNGDMDVALVKYRVAAVQTPHSAPLWNNIGMCFYGKQQFVAAIACLKRSLYLDPFEWITLYNLGLVHLQTEQFASAFHFFSASINMKGDFPSSYMYLGIALSNLKDFDNSCSAFEKAIEMERNHLFHLNYAIVLQKNDEMEQAKTHLEIFDELFSALDAETQNSDPDSLVYGKMNDEREKLWRQICRQFYFQNDALAQQILRQFEICKTDDTVISVETPMEKLSIVQENCKALGLENSSDPMHKNAMEQIIERYELIKNQIRSEYHQNLATHRYEEFHKLLLQRQSTNYCLDDKVLLVREKEAFIRLYDSHHEKMSKITNFLRQYMDTLGSHPFLLGLKQVIQWNLESSNIVGWRCKEIHVYHRHFINLWLIVVSDAVFLESAGKTFAADSVDLLINSLNFGHYELTKVATEKSEPRNRVWLMDPYLSDQDMRDLLHLFPPKYRLEGRPSGDKYMTGLFRMNLIGLCDEPQPFFQRWCVLL
ncbi:unnamed protein product [Albugo candida]|uniref:Uncharacterized protein n=1 Tax=Albugo candida TaxID=65357 RepID=A0A024G2J7_9STRA|nr:unnamed protein product [Albugo candida]|eukprot:CCI40533.1 unnamed protein product [Albugo candida]